MVLKVAVKHRFSAITTHEAITTTQCTLTEHHFNAEAKVSFGALNFLEWIKGSSEEKERV